MPFKNARHFLLNLVWLIIVEAAEVKQADDHQHWKFKYLSHPELRSYLVPPVYFPPDSKVVPIAILCHTLSAPQIQDTVDALNEARL